MSKNGGGNGAWGRLGDDENDDDPFAAAPSTNVSMMDLNDPNETGGGARAELGKGSYSRAFAASGEDLQWQLPPTPVLGKNDPVHTGRDDESHDDGEGRIKKDLPRT